MSNTITMVQWKIATGPVSAKGTLEICNDLRYGVFLVTFLLHVSFYGVFNKKIKGRSFTQK